MKHMDNLVHGKRSTYTKHKCRCPECRKANAEYKSNKVAYYRNLQASAIGEDTGASTPAVLAELTHGLPSTYEWYQCRCDACNKAEAEVANTRYLSRVFSTRS